MRLRNTGTVNHKEKMYYTILAIEMINKEDFIENRQEVDTSSDGTHTLCINGKNWRTKIAFFILNHKIR